MWHVTILDADDVYGRDVECLLGDMGITYTRRRRYQISETYTCDLVIFLNDNSSFQLVSGIFQANRKFLWLHYGDQRNIPSAQFRTDQGGTPILHYYIGDICDPNIQEELRVMINGAIVSFLRYT